MRRHLDVADVGFHAIHPFSSPTSKVSILQPAKSVSRKSSARKVRHILNDLMDVKDDYGSAVLEQNNRLVPIQRKKSSNLLEANGAKCKKIARLLKKNNKHLDPKLVTEEHAHNARLDNAHKVVSEVVSRSAVSRDSSNSIKTDQGDILLYGTSINRNTRSSKWNEGVNFCI